MSTIVVRQSGPIEAQLLAIEALADVVALEARATALEGESDEVHTVAASETAIKAIAAADRANGMTVVDATNDVVWIFDSGSSAGASAWVLVPDAGTGRWLRNHSSMADLSSTANAKGASLVGVEDAALRLTGANVETVTAELAARVLQAAADETAIKAIPAAARTDGTLIVDLTNNVVWQFDAGSAAGASAWVLVPDAGTGRWLRNQPSLVDLAGVAATTGANMIGIQDAATIYTATTVEDALAEVKVLADAGVGLQKRTLTSDHTTLVAAAATETVNIGAALPANSRILGVSMHTVTAFSGGTVGDFTVDVGMAGDVDAIVDGADLFAAAVDGEAATITAGIAPNKLYAAGGQLIATFRCGSDDVADATAGAVTIDVLFSVLA